LSRLLPLLATGFDAYRYQLDEARMITLNAATISALKLNRYYEWSQNYLLKSPPTPHDPRQPFAQDARHLTRPDAGTPPSGHGTELPEDRRTCRPRKQISRRSSARAVTQVPDHDATIRTGRRGNCSASVSRRRCSRG
jgi:hypothetical protein